MNVVLIDNFDSFTFNLKDEFARLGAKVVVYRNHIDAKQLEQNIEQLKGPKCLVISPGPGHPSEAGNCHEFIRTMENKIPILGICLGHQLIGQLYGATVKKGKYPVHGKADMVEHVNHPLFAGLPSPFKVGRYHSLEIGLCRKLNIIAKTDKTIMAVAHKQFPIYGLQFHPESILSTYGSQIISNFLKMIQFQS